MRRYPEKGGQFAIIWVDLLYEDAVPASGKILFGEIYRLSNADGWCNASNKEFMDLLGCSESTVRNLLRALEDVGQIRIETTPRRGESGGTERRIFCGRKLAPPDVERVPAENCGYPGGTRKNLRGVPAEICGSNKVLNNNKKNPPMIPQGVMDVIAAYAGEDEELRTALYDFCVNRATPPKACPVKTAVGMKRLLSDLDKGCNGDRALKLESIGESITHNWRGLFGPYSSGRRSESDRSDGCSREAGDTDGI